MGPTTPGLAFDLRSLLDRTGDLWERLRGARLFMTGGTGFVGRWLLEALSAADHAHGLNVRVLVLTRDPDAFARRAPELCSWPALTLLRGDVRSFDLPDGALDHVLHVASVPTPPTDAREILGLILEGTRRTLEAAVEGRAERFHFVSSGAVYGSQPSHLLRLPEDYPGAPDSLRPGSANGVGKRAAELMALLESEAHGFTVTVGRGFALLGPFLPLDGQFAAGNFLRDALAGGPLIVNGDGSPLRTYLYASEMAAWHWTIHLRGAQGKAYNVGGEEEVSIAELARRVAAARGPGIEVRVLETPVPNAVAPRFVPAVERARAELGLVPSIGLDEGIRRTLAFLGGVR